MRKEIMEKGFTVVEILISLVIISLTMMFVLGSFSQGFRYFLKCKDTTKLHRLAQGILEKERAKEYPLPSLVNDDWAACASPGNGEFRYRIYRQMAGDPPELVRVDLEIEGPYSVEVPAQSAATWPSAWKTPRFITYQITTFIARKPYSRAVCFKKKPSTGTGEFWLIRHSPASPRQLEN